MTAFIKFLENSIEDRSIYMIVVVVAIAFGVLERRRRNVKAARKALDERLKAEQASANLAAEQAQLKAINLHGLQDVAAECLRIADDGDAPDELKASLEDRFEMIKRNADRYEIALEEVIAEHDQFTLVASSTKAKLRLKEAATLLQKYRNDANELCKLSRSTSDLTLELKARVELRGQMDALLAAARKDGFSDPTILDHEEYVALLEASDDAKHALIALDAQAAANEEKFDGSATIAREQDDQVFFVNEVTDDDEPTIKLDRTAVDAAIAAAAEPFVVDEQELESAVSEMRVLDNSLN